ncbi:MAG: hypothetical protein NTX66_00530 [Candidatus Falkowbacteria bacterium]|nr:hypothetical protein [Candidatus Falkowbacteria bacterium]
MRNKKSDAFIFKKKHVTIFLAIIIFLLLLFFYFFKWSPNEPLKIDLQHKPDFFGVTFSKKFCAELSLDWKETYLALLDQLHVKYIRIPVYWDEIEKNEGQFNFSDYDYLLNEGEKRNVKFIISLGRRVPRWPECHTPLWLSKKSDIEAQQDTLKMLEAAVNHFKSRTNIEYWQVENEPFLSSFGVCPPLDKSFLQQEFALVRSLDGRQIIITASGELSSWRQEAKIGDIFGTTIYRVVYNNWFGFVRYPIPNFFYKLKARLAGLTPERLMVLELQTEPWVPEGKMIYLDEKTINKTMSTQQFKANLQYTINLDFRQTYLWGAEWWYWQKKYGNPEYWQIAETLFK